MIKTKDILKILDKTAPFDIAENWDNSGLQAGNLNREVKKIIIGLDVSTALMTAAEKGRYDLVITHHPLMIQGKNCIDFNTMPGKAIETAAKHDISIICVHTNLDKACEGLNEFFAKKIGLEKTKIFLPDNNNSTPLNKPVGIGRIGCLQSPARLKQVAIQIKGKLNLAHLRVTGNMDMVIRSIAVCTGSGGSLVDEFLKSSADLYITGDIKYHDARRVEECAKALIDVGHFSSEHMAIDLLFDKLNLAIQKEGLRIQIKKFTKEKDPFTTV